jgi:hypothetical protein
MAPLSPSRTQAELASEMGRGEPDFGSGTARDVRRQSEYHFGSRQIGETLDLAVIRNAAPITEAFLSVIHGLVVLCVGFRLFFRTDLGLFNDSRLGRFAASAEAKAKTKYGEQTNRS